MIELKEDIDDAVSDLSEWQDLLDNLEGVSAHEMFHYGVVITEQIQIYEERKRDTRRSYNIAVHNYNSILEISQRINNTLKPEEEFEGIGDFTEERQEFVGKSTVEELANKINGEDVDENA